MAVESITRVGSSALAQRISRQTHHDDGRRAEPSVSPNSEPRPDKEKQEAEESLLGYGSGRGSDTGTGELSLLSTSREGGEEATAKVGARLWRSQLTPVD